MRRTRGLVWAGSPGGSARFRGGGEGGTGRGALIQTIVNDKLSEYLEGNPGIAKRIIERAVNSAEAREAARKARDIVRRKNALESTNFPGKLADCSINHKSGTL